MRAGGPLAKGRIASEIESREDRNVVGGLFPAPRRAQDPAAMRRVRDVGRRPDVIEPAPLVGRVPVLGAIAPPRIKQPLGNVLPGHVDPAPGVARLRQMFDLNGRVRDDLQKRLVAPNVILARGDVQIAHQNRLLGSVREEIVAHMGQEIELLAEFLVLRAVRNVAARRHVEIVDRHAILEPRRHVPRLAKPGIITRPRLDERQLRQDRDAVVTLLAPRHHPVVAQRAETLERDLLDRALAFLQAEHVGRLLAQQLLDQPLAQADRIDVPGGKGEGHGRSPLRPRSFACADRKGKAPGPGDG
ncbi:hypothetical protein SDC9_06325 [bioreactor metagenome]|uniref:Uncharacterized protein n=1 Tax=bioreactor metagenome TaxID=1076179 RepID=A0A644T1H1_9ZZZZ